MHQQDKERVQRFMQDSLMAEIVKDQIQSVFLRKREGDVTSKAAQMMAIEMLDEAWKELQHHGRAGERQKPRQEAL